MLEFLDIDDKDVKEFHKRIVENVKRIRTAKKVTQADLAQTIGHKSVSTIGQIESYYKNKHYNIEQLYKISIALEVDICEFFK
ncbi:transcriptional regulator [Halarcobacter mediterraneus]|uniref:Transcriptional regulator n=1 Tax=Halarcobacter mediterraneus TaxID=2023153 RepID=A0A4Q1AXH9_9BACT|nr:helix-turn-helix transcriptional regulator [Halarcobacter mediterraneus]RXK14033.1 transcriptional regulator [Halarcobacter mediterraneus]